MSILAGMSIFCIQSCSKSGDLLIEEPPIPVESGNDTVTVKLISNLTVTEESLISRSGNSNDLIGVEIRRKKEFADWNTDILPPSVIYASGVFDDIDNIVFKFVKGGTYTIRMTFYPNAKNIVYNYPDGTFGSPFSCLYGLTKYQLNQPVYYAGLEGGWSGDTGPVLDYIIFDQYQPTEDRYIQSFKRGTTPRYSGQLNEIVINDDTAINIKLELCMMAITLKPENFTEGKLSLWFSQDNEFWEVSPGDEMTKKFQISYYDSQENLELFYTDGEGNKYLLATKLLTHKRNANFVFSFNLTKRADGSIGIQLPSDETMVEEDATFDF